MYIFLFKKIFYIPVHISTLLVLTEKNIFLFLKYRPSVCGPRRINRGTRKSSDLSKIHPRLSVSLVAKLFLLSCSWAGTHGDFHGFAGRIETSLLSNEVCRRLGTVTTPEPRRLSSERRQRWRRGRRRRRSQNEITAVRISPGSK